MTDEPGVRVELPGLPTKGVMLDELTVWRDPETGSVVFMLPVGRVSQVSFTAEQWKETVRFLDEEVSDG